jgi:hypothetical protein
VLILHKHDKRATLPFTKDNYHPQKTTTTTLVLIFNEYFFCIPASSEAFFFAFGSATFFLFACSVAFLLAVGFDTLPDLVAVVSGPGLADGTLERMYALSGIGADTISGLLHCVA